MLSVDHDFTAFLASRDVCRLALEKPVPDFRTVRTRRYDEATADMLRGLHAPTVVVPDPVPRVRRVRHVPVAPVANIAIPRPKFTFTPEQIAIAIGVRTRQMKEAS